MVKRLGNILNQRLVDDDDLRKKKYTFMGCQENAQIMSYVNMIQELIAAHNHFKIIQNLYKNEIIEFIF